MKISFEIRYGYVREQDIYKGRGGGVENVLLEKGKNNPKSKQLAF